ncbi:MAG: hypothetical protein R8G66_06380 [Cytophagales bacterium]|nr:hypothetical protein [Cytophagales bacterium]
MKRDLSSFPVPLLLIAISILLGSCQYESRKDKVRTEIRIKTIDLMQHAVVPYLPNADLTLPKTENSFKIVTYGDLYCHPCWKSIWPWRSHILSFDTLDNVSFFCYVGATKEDFKLANIEVGFEFPVFLDTRDRFRIVNELGNEPQELTFLLDNQNRVLLTGPPFTAEMKKKYLDIIQN